MINKHKLFTLNSDFSKNKVLIWGDIMLDRYWEGPTTRISPEAPIPITHVEQNEYRLGGAANVALNLAHLGVSTKLFGTCGQDESATILKQLLKDNHIDYHILETDQPTTTKLRVMSMNRPLIRLDFEQNVSLVDKDILKTSCMNSFGEANTLVISDYNKGCIDNKLKLLIQAAKTYGLRTLVDPKSNDMTLYEGADLITPNLKEFEAIVGECSSDFILAEKAHNLMSQFNFQAILITMGAKGMALIEQGQAPYMLGANTKEVFDVTGAGDTVIATVAAMLSTDHSYQQAVTVANIAAGIAVTKLGTASVTMAEIHKFIHQQFEVHTGVIEQAPLKEELAKAKLRSEKVVMTNGCFDLLHSGHIQYLEEAKALGDWLIVAVNDDESVRSLKGKQRPLNTLSRRMKVLASLKCVDWVIPFSGSTPRDLIADLLPDILVKGGDWEIKDIAGAKEVIAHGGEVKTLSFEQGISTTTIINKILETCHVVETNTEER